MSCETCQFCEKFNGRTGRNHPRTTQHQYEGKIKYGVRHYAHFDCFLEHKGIEAFKALNSFHQGQFPYKLLKAWGLMKVSA